MFPVPAGPTCSSSGPHTASVPATAAFYSPTPDSSSAHPVPVRPRLGDRPTHPPSAPRAVSQSTTYIAEMLCSVKDEMLRDFIGSGFRTQRRGRLQIKIRLFRSRLHFFLFRDPTRLQTPTMAAQTRLFGTDNRNPPSTNQRIGRFLGCLRTTHLRTSHGIVG